MALFRPRSTIAHFSGCCNNVQGRDTPAVSTPQVELRYSRFIGQLLHLRTQDFVMSAGAWIAAFYGEGPDIGEDQETNHLGIDGAKPVTFVPADADSQRQFSEFWAIADLLDETIVKMKAVQYARDVQMAPSS
jgi:hypothetical protein